MALHAETFYVLVTHSFPTLDNCSINVLRIEQLERSGLTWSGSLNIQHMLQAEDQLVLKRQVSFYNYTYLDVLVGCNCRSSSVPQQNNKLNRSSLTLSPVQINRLTIILVT
jgi:hypothetical protein